MKRTVLFVAIMVMVVLVGCKADDKKESLEGLPNKVIIGTEELANDETIAKAQNYFEQEMGVEVEIKSFNAGRDVVAAARAGDIDFGMTGVPTFTLAVCEDTDIQMIWLHSIAGSSEALVAKQETGATKVEDLKGMTVATPFASTTHFSLLYALKNAGMSTKDINLVDIASTEINAAWETGQIDAAYIYDPMLSSLNNATVICTSGEMAGAGFMTYDLEFVRTEFAEQYPEIVVAYIRAVSKGVDLYQKDRANAIDIISQYMNLEKDDVEHQLEGIIWVTPKEQLEPKYFGTDGTGALAQNLNDIATFMKEQETIQNIPEMSVFEKALNSAYIKMSLK